MFGLVCLWNHLSIFVVEVWTWAMAGITFVITTPPHSLVHAIKNKYRRQKQKQGCVQQIVSIAPLVTL